MSIDRLASRRAIEWFCEEVARDHVTKVFNDITSDGEEIGKFFGKIAKDHKRQALRFLELVERTDDIEKWLSFLEHEQKREESAWRDEKVKEFIERAREWVKNTNPQCVIEAEKRLSKWLKYQGSLTDEEREILKLRAMRTALYVTLKGLTGESK